MQTSTRFLSRCAAGVVLALMVVGVVSGTLLRHVVQVIPLLLAIMLSRFNPGAAAYALLPLFVFWSAISLLIWMFLLGVSRIANGTYTPIEIASTVVMAACSTAGLIAIVRFDKRLRGSIGIAISIAFFAAQVFFMWVSSLRQLANR